MQLAYICICCKLMNYSYICYIATSCNFYRNANLRNYIKTGTHICFLSALIATMIIRISYNTVVYKDGIL